MLHEGSHVHCQLSQSARFSFRFRRNLHSLLHFRLHLRLRAGCFNRFHRLDPFHEQGLTLVTGLITLRYCTADWDLHQTTNQQGEENTAKQGQYNHSAAKQINHTGEEIDKRQINQSSNRCTGEKLTQRLIGPRLTGQRSSRARLVSVAHAENAAVNFTA